MAGYLFSRKRLVRICFVMLWLMMVEYGIAESIGIEEIGESIREREASDSIKSARVVYTRDWEISSGISKQFYKRTNAKGEYSKEQLELVEKEAGIQQKRRTRMELVIDCNNQRWKERSTDLRDVDRLMLDCNLPEREYINISSTMVKAVEGNYMVDFRGKEVTGDYPPMLSISKIGKAGIKGCNHPVVQLGDISERFVGFLEKQKDVTISEVNVDGEDLVQIEIKKDSGNGEAGKILIDPQVGYRLRLSESRKGDGQLLRERIADDYREINGIPFPFLYKERRFDEDGNLLLKLQFSIEEVELNIDVNDRDFELFVPAGTQIEDSAVGMQVFNVDRELGWVGIKDVIKLAGANMAKTP